MSRWITKFFDDFDDNSIGISTSPGGGAITEPVGTELLVSITAGNNAHWWDGEYNAPIGYESISTHEDPRPSLMRFETKISSFTGRSGTELIPGITIWGPSQRDMYWLGWYDANDDMYVQRGLDGTFTTRWNAGNYGDPNSTPHIYRIYINRLQKKAWLTEVNRWIEPGNVAFVFSSNNGSSWVFGYQEDLAFLPTNFGVFMRNLTYNRGGTAGFDYLKFEQDFDPQVVIGEREYATEPQASAQVEIEADTRGMGGDEGVGVTPSVKGDAHVEIDALPDEIDADKHEGLGFGTLLRDPGVQIETSELADVVDADVMVEKPDSDGEDLLTSGEVTDIHIIDATAGSFGNPVSGNHWGAAKDGKFYANGVECGPGDFGTIASGLRTSAWRFSGQDPHGHADGTTVFGLAADDALRIQGVWSAWANPGGLISNYRRWSIEAGDFDIQVDFSNYVVNAGSEGESRLAVTANGPGGTNQFYINRDANGTYRAARITNGGYASLGTTGTTDTSGKLRITRVSGVLTAYKWNGSSWDQVGGTYSHANFNGSLYVNMGSSGNNNTNTDITFSNFTINSGTTTNRAGWYKEASGTDRGTQQSMPDFLLAICSVATVTLVDPVNNKMWMRFVRSGNNALHYYSSYGQRPWKVSWSNGLLMIAHGASTTQNEEGGAIYVDFTFDVIRIHRRSASTVCGGYCSNNAWSNPTGGIDKRNGNYSYSGDYDEWDIQDYRVYDVDIYHDGDYEYRAVCSHDGVRIFKVKRFYLLDPTGLENSSGPESTRMLWCEIDQSDGELFYMDTTTMYSRNKSGGGVGWEDWMTGGTWTAQYSKALPGFRSFEYQLRPTRFDPYIFLPANEGVYRINWPSGSWELFYGKSGSGATHEILPDYDMITSIEKGQDDAAADLLVVALALEQRGQIVAVKLSDNTVYGRSEKVDLKVPSVVAA